MTLVMTLTKHILQFFFEILFERKLSLNIKRLSKFIFNKHFFISDSQGGKNCLFLDSQESKIICFSY